MRVGREIGSEAWQFELAHLDEWQGGIDVPTVEEGDREDDE